MSADLTRDELRRLVLEREHRSERGEIRPFGDDRRRWQRLTRDQREGWLDNDNAPNGTRTWMRLGERGERDHRYISEHDSRDKTLYEKLRERLLLDTATMSPVFDPSGEESRTLAYLPGLWNHGTIPALVGPKGWGKTLWLTQLCAALVIPDREFLGCVPAAQMTREERARDVLLINAEVRPAAVHEALLAAGLIFDYRGDLPCYRGPDADDGVLVVEHLPQMGGPTFFDLTDPSKALLWEERLTTRASGLPLTVIADGITSVLENNTGRTGAFTSAFRRLLREIDVSNGLGVLHSPMSPSVDTPMGGLESMGEWDGIWAASAPRFPIRTADPRYFETYPRLGDPEWPRRRIVLGEDGMLLAETPSTSTGTGTGERRPGPAPRTREQVREQVLAVLGSERGDDGDGWLWTKQVCGVGEQRAENKSELEALAEAGQVERRERTGRPRGTQWRLLTARGETGIS